VFTMDFPIPGYGGNEPRIWNKKNVLDHRQEVMKTSFVGKRDPCSGKLGIIRDPGSTVAL